MEYNICYATHFSYHIQFAHPGIFSFLFVGTQLAFVIYLLAEPDSNTIFCCSTLALIHLPTFCLPQFLPIFLCPEQLHPPKYRQNFSSSNFGFFRKIKWSLEARICSFLILMNKKVSKKIQAEHPVEVNEHSSSAEKICFLAIFYMSFKHARQSSVYISKGKFYNFIAMPLWYQSLDDVDF